MDTPKPNQPDEFETIVIENDLEPFIEPIQQSFIEAIDHRVEYGPPLSETDKAVIYMMCNILKLGSSRGS
jgi:hypothetical protein